MVKTGINYKGEVTLSYKLGNKIIKKKSFNKGWSQLFRLISLVLTGNMTTEELVTLRPTFIDLKYKDNNDHWDSCLYSRVPVTPSFIAEADPSIDGGIGYISTFTVTISYSNLNQSLVTAFTADKEVALFLLSGESYNPEGQDADAVARMASLIVDPISVQEMLPGSQVIVEWTMRFYNA